MGGWSYQLCALHAGTAEEQDNVGFVLVFVFIFHPRNHYRMISDLSKKEDLQKEKERERNKEST
jgi:hypothetical protein